MKITSKDVAREAGVSQTTVSLILNGRNLDSFTSETRDNVLTTAKRLGYIPSTAAKALRLGRNDIIVCLIPDLPITAAMDEFKTMLSTRLSKAGLVCVFFHYAEMVDELAALWGRLRPALVISFTALPDHDYTTLINAGIPCINGLFDRKSSGHSESGLDQRGIGMLQAKHLHERNFHRIVFIGINDPREFLFCEARADGVKSYCERNGIPFRQHMISEYNKQDAELVINQVDLTEGRLGIAAFNDMTAITLLSTLKLKALKAPLQYGLIGVDNLPVSELMFPMISTIELNLAINADYLTYKVLVMLGKQVDKKIELTLEKAHSALRIIHRETT